MRPAARSRSARAATRNSRHSRDAASARARIRSSSAAGVSSKVSSSVPVAGLTDWRLMRSSYPGIVIPVTYELSRIAQTGTRLASLECGAEEERGVARAWMPGDPGDDELEPLFAADREAWRVSAPDDGEAWRTDASDEAWRG